jgi:hypothetical protein
MNGGHRNMQSSRAFLHFFASCCFKHRFVTRTSDISVGFARASPGHMRSSSAPNTPQVRARQGNVCHLEKKDQSLPTPAAHDVGITGAAPAPAHTSPGQAATRYVCNLINSTVSCLLSAVSYLLSDVCSLLAHANHREVCLLSAV